MPPAGDRWTPEHLDFLRALWRALLPLPAESARYEALKLLEAEIFPQAGARPDDD